MDNIFSEMNASKSKISENIKKTAKNYLPYILLALNIVFRTILQLYNPRLVNPFTPVFVLDAITGVISTMFCYIVFIPLGERNEKLNNPSYKSNCAEWSRLSEIIRNGNLQVQFRKYCINQIEVERKEKRIEIIGSRTALSFEEYETRYATIDAEQLKGEYKASKLTKREYKAILHANEKIRVKPINPALILSGVVKFNYNDAGRERTSYAVKWLSQRPLMIIFGTIVLNTLSATFTGLSGFSAVYNMVLDALFTVFASFVGYGAGEETVRDKNDRIKGKILFICGFLEENKADKLKQ